MLRAGAVRPLAEDVNLMNRFLQIAAVMACGALLSSCRTPTPTSVPDTGEQNGRFGAGEHSTICSGYCANICVIKGTALAADGHVIGPTRSLVYILSGLPNGRLTNAADDDAQYISTWSCTWATSSNSMTYSLAWNRRTDVISAGGRSYKRSSGNFFVFTLDSAGGLACRQLPVLSSSADCSAALNHVRRYLKNDQFAALLLAEFQTR